MPRRLSLAILLGLITTAVLSFGITAGAAPGDEATGDDETAAAQQRLAEIRMKAGSAYEAHDNAVFQLAKLDDEIAATGEELAAAQDELDAAEGELQERAAQMYKSGNVGFVDVLVGAEDFSEFANRLELWMDLIIQERDEFDRVREARDALAQKKADLEAQRDKRAAALADADAQIDRASGLEADAKAYLDSLNAEVREALEAEQARQAQHAEEEALEHAEEEALAVRRAPIGSGAEEESAPALAPVRSSVDQALADRRAEREAAEAYAAEKAAEAEQARLAAEGEQAAEDAEAMLAAAEAAERRAAIAEERAAASAAAEEAAAQEAEELAAAQEQYAADQAALDAAEQQYADGQEDTGGETTGSGGQYGSGGGDQYGSDQYGSGPTTGAAGAQPSSTGGGGASCADDFGGVQPHVAQIGCDLQDKFGLRITGIGYSDYHWDGLDLDIWTTSVTLGNQVRDYALANYAVEYTCWQDRYVNVLTGWEEGCAGHMDHVHITFRP